MQREGFLNRIVHVSCARRTKEEGASAVFIIQFLLTYFFFFFFPHPYRSANHNTHRTALHCIARFSYCTVNWRRKTKTTTHLLLFPHLCVADRQQGIGRSTELSRRRPAKLSEICFALRRGSRLSPDRRRSTRRRVVFIISSPHPPLTWTGEVEHTSRHSINRTCEFKGRREAATCLKSVE